MNKIQTENAPEAIGPYSQAITTDHLIFCSGQIGLDPKNAELAEGLENQTKQVMQNLSAVLKEINLSFANVVKTEIFITDINNFPKINEIYGSFLKEPFPSRSTVEVSGLPKGALIEISCIAIKND